MACASAERIEYELRVQVNNVEQVHCCFDLFCDFSYDLT